MRRGTMLVMYVRQMLMCMVAGVFAGRLLAAFIMTVVVCMIKLVYIHPLPLTV